jgi:hypothetical protein
MIKNDIPGVFDFWKMVKSYFLFNSILKVYYFYTLSRSGRYLLAFK